MARQADASPADATATAPAVNADATGTVTNEVVDAQAQAQPQAPSADEVEKIGNVTIGDPANASGSTVEDNEVARKVNTYEDALRRDNPNKVVYREAGSVPGIGGESFDYGQPAEAEQTSEASQQQ